MRYVGLILIVLLLCGFGFADRYICPKCQSDVAVSYIATNPGTTCFRCTNPECDYHHDLGGYDPDESEIIEVAPF